MYNDHGCRQVSLFTIYALIIILTSLLSAFRDFVASIMIHLRRRNIID
jgi:hypothetical protein